MSKAKVPSILIMDRSSSHYPDTNQSPSISPSLNQASVLIRVWDKHPGWNPMKTPFLCIFPAMICWCDAGMKSHIFGLRSLISWRNWTPCCLKWQTRYIWIIIIAILTRYTGSWLCKEFVYTISSDFWSKCNSLSSLTCYLGVRWCGRSYFTNAHATCSW